MHITSRDEAMAQLSKFTQFVGDKTLFLEARIPSGGHAEIRLSKQCIELSLVAEAYRKTTVLELDSHDITQNKRQMPDTYLNTFYTEITKLLSSRHLKWQERWRG